jgi:hypothetical protein
MPNQFFPQGEIYPPERVLDADVARNVGSYLLEVGSLYAKRFPMFRDRDFAIRLASEPAHRPTFDADSRLVRIEEEHLTIVRSIEALFVSRLPRNILFQKITTELAFGAGAAGHWHVDVERNVRAILNLSQDPIHLHYATDWDGADYGRAKSKFDRTARPTSFIRPEPRDFNTFISEPGEAVVINNLARADRQIPHRAVPFPAGEPARLIMRLTASM